jgi:hypothetical protein
VISFHLRPHRCLAWAPVFPPSWVLDQKIQGLLRMPTLVSLFVLAEHFECFLCGASPHSFFMFVSGLFGDLGGHSSVSYGVGKVVIFWLSLLSRQINNLSAFSRFLLLQRLDRLAIRLGLWGRCGVGLTFCRPLSMLSWLLRTTRTLNPRTERVMSTLDILVGIIPGGRPERSAVLRL